MIPPLPAPRFARVFASIVTALSVGVLPVALAESPGALDPTFSFHLPIPELNAPRVKQVEGIHHGQVIVLSSHTSDEGNIVYQLRRANGDGSIDPTFPALTVTYENGDAIVEGLAIEPDGQIVIGGFFTHVGATARSSIARLHANGTVDSTFDSGSGPDGDIRAITITRSGEIVVGGSFSVFDGVPRDNLALVDSSGNVIAGFQPVVDNFVTTVAIDSSDKIYAGGSFTLVDGEDRAGIARFHPNGNLDTHFNPVIGDPVIGIAGSVYDLAIDPFDRPVVAGFLTKGVAFPRDDVARLHPNGNLDTNFAPSPGLLNASPTTLAIDTSGRILVGGYFTDVDGVGKNHLIRMNRDGSVDPHFNTLGGPDGESGELNEIQVGDLHIDTGGRVYIAGSFTSVDGVSVRDLARLHGGESDAVPGINITFDYRYDTSRFFAGDNIGRRLVLEEAARVYEPRLLDRLDPIAPPDSDPNTIEGWQAQFTHPGNGFLEELDDLHVPANTLIVFVGADNTDFEPGDLAKASADYQIENATFTHGQILSRGGGIATGDGATDYSGWGGSIRFDPGESWFDSPPPGAVDPGAYDLYSTALHELAHLLGIAVGTPSWDNLMLPHSTEQVRYNGARGKLVTGGIPVFVDRIDVDGTVRIGSHFTGGTESVVVGTSTVQSSILVDTLSPGERRFLTELDLAALDDIGWDVSWPSTQPPVNRAAIRKKIAQTTAALKKAKKSGNRAKVKALLKQLTNLKRQLL